MIKLREYNEEEFTRINECVARTSPMSTHYNSVNFLESYLFNKKRRIISKVLKDFNTKSVIDIGCGDGGLAEILSTNIIKYVGVDISPTQISNAKKRVQRKEVLFKVGDACKMNFPENSFTAAVCTDVIEHVQNPAKLLDTLKQIVVNDGYILISIPNEYFWALARLILLRFPLHTPDHLYAIFPRDIKKRFKTVEKIIHLPFNTFFCTSLMSVFLIKNVKLLPHETFNS